MGPKQHCRINLRPPTHGNTRVMIAFTSFWGTESIRICYCCRLGAWLRRMQSWCHAGSHGVVGLYVFTSQLKAVQGVPPAEAVRAWGGALSTECWHNPMEHFTAGRGFFNTSPPHGMKNPPTSEHMSRHTSATQLDPLASAVPRVWSTAAPTQQLQVGCRHSTASTEGSSGIGHPSPLHPSHPSHRRTYYPL